MWRWALLDHRWYQAGTAGTRLMGPYGVRDADGFLGEEAGDAPVTVIRQVVADTR